MIELWLPLVYQFVVLYFISFVDIELCRSEDGTKAVEMLSSSEMDFLQPA
jgi:hypothetical protein